MTDTPGEKPAAAQKFSNKAPVVNMVACVDYFFRKLGISNSSCRNPSGKNDSFEKVAGLTNIYLKPTRIGRKAVLGSAVFFYGRKFDLLPVAYEIVPYDAPADVFSFVENRIRETLTDYLSIHKGSFMLNLDIRDGVITDLSKIGFDDQFNYLEIDKILSIGDLSKIINSLRETA